MPDNDYDGDDDDDECPTCKWLGAFTVSIESNFGVETPALTVNR